jgi:hypothetical protein
MSVQVFFAEGGVAKRSADRPHLWFRTQGMVHAAP